jgi:hypothetical protein
MKPSPLNTLPRLSLLFFVLLQSLATTTNPATTAPERAVAANAAAVTRDVRFGLNQAWEAPEAADQAGAGWSRLMFWWSALQPNGPQDWNDYATDHDSYIDEELARGRELVGVVINTPAWASASGSPNAVPANLYTSWNDPKNNWGRFVQKLAAHYKGRIDSWIIWNEVDIPNGQWRTWDGTVDDYAQLMRVAYPAIKAGNPRAKVALYGSPWWYDKGAFISRLLDNFAADPAAPANNFYFDVANLHMYSRANDIPRIIGWYQDQLATRGMGPKAVWIGETNAVPYDDPLWPAIKGGFRASLDEQASYLTEAFATYLGLGVERIGVNRILDGADFDAGGEPFGLLRNDRSARPAYRAFSMITRYYSGARTAAYYPTDEDGVTRVVLDKDGERVTVLWTMQPGGATVAVDASSAIALAVTKYGEASALYAQEGQYWIDLPGATANSDDADPQDYVVGGSPIILVERLDGNVEAAYRSMDVTPQPANVSAPLAVAAPASVQAAPVVQQPAPASRATPAPTPRPAATPAPRPTATRR